MLVERRRADAEFRRKPGERDRLDPSASAIRAAASITPSGDRPARGISGPRGGRGNRGSAARQRRAPRRAGSGRRRRSSATCPRSRPATSRASAAGSGKSGSFVPIITSAGALTSSSFGSTSALEPRSIAWRAARRPGSRRLATRRALYSAKSSGFPRGIERGVVGAPGGRTPGADEGDVEGDSEDDTHRQGQRHVANERADAESGRRRSVAMPRRPRPRRRRRAMCRRRWRDRRRDGRQGRQRRRRSADVE